MARLPRVGRLGSHENWKTDQNWQNDVEVGQCLPEAFERGTCDQESRTLRSHVSIEGLSLFSSTSKRRLRTFGHSGMSATGCSY